MAELQITSGGSERVQATADLLSEAFESDPTTTYFLSSLTPQQRAAYRPTFIRAVLTAVAANNASFDEIGRWKSCGVLYPPGSNADRIAPALYPLFLSVAWSIGFRGCQRMLWETAPISKACKAKALRGEEPYYYVMFLGTREEGRGRGLCSAMVRHYQALAAREQVPVYMEAATAYSRRLYERLGFATVDEIVVGEGKAAADGTACVGGPGVRTWGMIWRPERVE